MDRTITFTTDAATLAVFDAAAIEHRVDDAEDWWATEFHTLPEVALGQIALVGLGGDGTYTVRISDGDLEDVERAYAGEFVVLGLEVESGKILVGPGEYLPGAGTVAMEEDFAPYFVDVEPGDYLVWAFRLRWWQSSEFGDGGKPAPPDLVLLLRTRDEDYVPPETEPRLYGSGDAWLYPDEPRQIGPKEGMVLTTTVVVRGKEKLLKPAGPLNYRPVLPNMEGLAWRDQVEVRVVAVHPDTETYTVELLRKLPRAE